MSKLLYSDDIAIPRRERRERKEKFEKKRERNLYLKLMGYFKEEEEKKKEMEKRGKDTGEIKRKQVKRVCS